MKNIFIIKHKRKEERKRSVGKKSSKVANFNLQNPNKKQYIRKENLSILSKENENGDRILSVMVVIMFVVCVISHKWVMCGELSFQVQCSEKCMYQLSVGCILLGARGGSMMRSRPHQLMKIK